MQRLTAFVLRDEEEHFCIMYKTNSYIKCIRISTFKVQNFPIYKFSECKDKYFRNGLYKVSSDFGLMFFVLRQYSIFL